MLERGIVYMKVEQYRVRVMTAHRMMYMVAVMYGACDSWMACGGSSGGVVCDVW